MNPGAKIALVVDTQAKATELLNRCKSFLLSLAITPTTENTRKITLPNRAEIHAITATGGRDGNPSKVGRSQSFQWIHISELPYWPNQAAYASLLATSSGAPVIIESTANGANDLFHTLWSTTNDYQKIFFSVEQHQEYQLPQEQITQELWDEAQSLGFTSRTHAAWWYHALQAAGNDRIQHLHDYPVIPEHAFLAKSGRWIHRDPEIAAHRELSNIEITQENQPHTRYVAGVDTSGGVGRDRNAIAVLNAATYELCATYRSSTDTVAELVQKLKLIQRLYNPIFIIETNGIGQATYQAAKQAKLECLPHTTTNTTKYQGLLLIKNKIENGTIKGTQAIQEEAQSLATDKRGNFTGTKDLLMAASFAALHIQRDPYRPAPPLKRQDVYVPPNTAPQENWY